MKQSKITPEEHARMNDELRREDPFKRKKTAQAIFTAILVLIGLFIVGGTLYSYLPSPFNIIALLGLALLWGHIYE